MLGISCILMRRIEIAFVLMKGLLWALESLQDTSWSSESLNTDKSLELSDWPHPTSKEEIETED